MSEKLTYRKKAAALTYSGVGAPILVAKGEGDYAHLIVEAGKEAEVPIIEGEELSSYLQKVTIGSEVPQALFESVAIVLSWAYFLRGKEP
tara:strand:+ start:80 stop:349 length:270 start_codon:yes stop_codon:yes gene_type:complete